MKILCFADLHHRSSNYFKCLSDISNKDFDIVISLGDNSYYDFLEIKNYINKNIYGILGNHDSFRTLEESEIINIHKKSILIKSFNISGYQGSCKYKKGYFPSSTQEESIEILNKMPKSDILISHEGPYLLYGNELSHCGLQGITNYINKNKPLLNIHGHYHKNIKTEINNTTVVSVYGIVRINTDTMEINICNT